MGRPPPKIFGGPSPSPLDLRPCICIQGNFSEIYSRLLTEDVESCLVATQRNTRRHVRRYATERPVVLDSIDPQDPQITSLLKPPTCIRQLTTVQGPVERDQLPVWDVAAQTNVLSLRDVLVDGGRIEIKTILLLSDWISSGKKRQSREKSKSGNHVTSPDSVIHFRNGVKRDERKSALKRCVRLTCVCPSWASSFVWMTRSIGWLAGRSDGWTGGGPGCRSSLESLMMARTLRGNHNVGPAGPGIHHHSNNTRNARPSVHSFVRPTKSLMKGSVVGGRPGSHYVWLSPLAGGRSSQGIAAVRWEERLGWDGEERREANPAFGGAWGRWCEPGKRAHQGRCWWTLMPRGVDGPR